MELFLNLLKESEEELIMIDKELAALPPGQLIKRKKYYCYKYNGEEVAITKNPKLIEELLRKRYLLERKAQLEQNISIISRVITKLDTKTPKELIQQLPKAYQDMPSHHFYHPSIKEFLEKSYPKNPFPMEGYHTKNGIQVRSKSEAIIGSKLEEYDIPYRYEIPLILGNQKKYPDFTIKNPFTGKTVIWEHFGALNQPEYEQKMNNKMTLYLKSGYTPLKNLIYTFEFDIKTPKRLKNLIEQVILAS